MSDKKTVNLEEKYPKVWKRQVRNETYEYGVTFFYGPGEDCYNYIKEDIQAKFDKKMLKNIKKIKDLFISGDYCGIYDKDLDVIWVDNTKELTLDHKICTLTHEIFHLIAHITYEKGVKYDYFNQEPFAYLMDFWVRGFLPLLLEAEKARIDEAEKTTQEEWKKDATTVSPEQLKVEVKTNDDDQKDILEVLEGLKIVANLYGDESTRTQLYEHLVKEIEKRKVKS